MTTMFERIDRARPAWMARGECRTPRVAALIAAGKVDFFPSSESGIGAGPAKRICADCPVRIECFEYAVERWELQGVWGGFGRPTREQERARRRREAGAA